MHDVGFYKIDFLFAERENEPGVKTSNSTLLNCDKFFNVGNRLLLDLFFGHHNFFLKSFVHYFAKLTHLT
jgi:hypothetical protein